MHNILQIFHRPSEPVNTGHHQIVAFAKEVEQDLQFGPCAALAT